MIKIFRGEGGSSERCLKWGGGGSLRDLSKNILKQGVGKGQKLLVGGRGFEAVTTPAPPENFNHTHSIWYISFCIQAKRL